ncbi:MAG: type II toxin-antitoxin system YafQ family toxin [Bacteroidetes bacterium]|nr:type II toxin-antitoxin system YafQ family toxin [Bacteroidota bacterium]
MPGRYKNHPLTGDREKKWDLHITPDWVLLYKKDRKKAVIQLARMGTHSDLFKK